MSKWMIAAAVSVFLGATSVALGQLHRPPEQSAGMMPAPMTPELKARLDQAERSNNAALAALDAGRYAEAEADARQSLSVDVGSGLSREFLAAALDAQGKTQEALQAYKAIANAGDVIPRNELPYALLLLKGGQWVQAVEAYNKQLPYNGDGDLIRAYSDFSPDVPRPADLMTAIHIGLGLDVGWWRYHGTYRARCQEAQAHFQQALALEPNSPLANYYYGYGLRRLGRRAEAMAAFQKAAALDHGDVKRAAEEALKRG